ncbi:leukotriene B4 receptor 1-like isoform X1 [Scleropages formosus]|nr:leukotriene B4 receptor 1-like isoform X1 [Scleropages formosus]
MSACSNLTTMTNEPDTFQNTIPPDLPAITTSSPKPPPVGVGISFLVAALVVGLPGNLFVVWTVLCRLRRKSITTLLVLQLAVADSFVLLTAPFFLRQLAINGIWEFGDWACRLLHYSCGVNMYISVYLITLMGADRLLGVSRPFLSQRVRTKSRLWPTTGAVLIVALLLSIPVAVYREEKKQKNNSYCLAHYPSKEHEVFHYCLETVAAFLLPFSALAVCYCRISRTLQAARVRWRQRNRKGTSRLIVLIMGSFILLWAPYHFVNVLQTAALLAGKPGESLLSGCKKARPILIALAFLSSSINPLLYACAGSTFMGTSGLSCITRLLEGTSSECNSKRLESRGEKGDGGKQSAGSLRMTEVQDNKDNDEQKE